jgi:chemotaxis response regulator CheB
MERGLANAPVSNSAAISLVAIVLSAGGLKALREVVAALRHDLPAAVLVAQHIQETTLLPKILSSDTAMPVSFASPGALLLPGRIYVCPAAHHLTVNSNALTVSRGPRCGSSDRAEIGYSRARRRALAPGQWRSC